MGTKPSPQSSSESAAAANQAPPATSCCVPFSQIFGIKSSSQKSVPKSSKEDAVLREQPRQQTSSSQTSRDTLNDVSNDHSMAPRLARPATAPSGKAEPRKRLNAIASLRKRLQLLSNTKAGSETSSEAAYSPRNSDMHFDNTSSTPRSLAGPSMSSPAPVAENSATTSQRISVPTSSLTVLPDIPVMNLVPGEAARVSNPADNPADQDSMPHIESPRYERDSSTRTLTHSSSSSGSSLARSSSSGFRGRGHQRRIVISKIENNCIGKYECLALIGKGSFGKVFLASTPEHVPVAVKVLPKARLATRRKQRLLADEKQVMVQCGQHPFILALIEAFQTKDHICLVSEFCEGGEMFFHLDRAGHFQEISVRFYCAEIASALVHLHRHRIAYRDLKSENILLDRKGHIRLADFGLAAPNVSEWRGARSVCGTPAYIAPEMIRQGGRSGIGYGYCVDWWALGTLMYDMLIGHPPFYSASMDTMCENILNRQLTFPVHVRTSSAARDIIRRFLRRTPEQRLGASTAGGYEAVLKHPFFSSVDWVNLISNARRPAPVQLRMPSRAVQPAGSSKSDEAFDIRNFHSDFTNTSVEESLRVEPAPRTSRRRRSVGESTSAQLLSESSPFLQNWNYVAPPRNSMSSMSFSEASSLSVA